MTALVVLAKVPRAGHVKTRLTPPLSARDAAAVAAAALLDTLRAVEQVPDVLRVLALDDPVLGGPARAGRGRAGA